MEYDKLAKGYDELHREEQLKKLSIIKEHIKIKSSTKLLDVGCGTGLSTEGLTCVNIGIDPSFEMLKQGKGRRVQGVAEGLPFKDNTFDIVFSITAIHNFHDVAKGLREIKRVGKDKFILTVLKKSIKAKFISDLIELLFDVKEKIEEEKDIIFII